MIAAVLGFMVLNFPMGKIFLGDGGAYALGHLLVWSAIILINSETKISAFSYSLFFWPVANTGLAYSVDGSWATPLAADRLHFHQLAMRSSKFELLVVTGEQLQARVYSDTPPPDFSPQVLGVLFGKTLSFVIASL